MNSISLRPMTRADLEFVLAAEHDPDHAPFVGRWVREQHLQAFDDPDFAQLMVLDQQGCSVGHIIFADRTDASRNLLLKRIIIMQKGKGYGRAALAAVQKLAFMEYGTHRLWLDVIETNERARSLYRTVGFQEEGTLREALLHNGCYVSLVIMSMLTREYQG